MILELPQQRLNLLIVSQATRSRKCYRGHGGVEIQPTSSAPTMDAISNRIRRRLGIRFRISHFSLRRLRWAGYSLHKGF